MQRTLLCISCRCVEQTCLPKLLCEVCCVGGRGREDGAGEEDGGKTNFVYRGRPFSFTEYNTCIKPYKGRKTNLWFYVVA